MSFPSLRRHYSASSLAFRVFRERSLVRVRSRRLLSRCTPSLDVGSLAGESIRQEHVSSDEDPDSPGWCCDLCTTQCCLRLRCSERFLSSTFLPRRLRPWPRDRLPAPHGPFRSFVSDSVLPYFTSSYLFLSCLATRSVTTGWMTSPFPGGVVPTRSQPIARLNGQRPDSTTARPARAGIARPPKKVEG